jgi:phenylpyruvate tautomerase PptA (4-oxalocrotonate tautomerase family)
MTVMRVVLAGAQLSPESKSDAARRLMDAFAEVEVGASSEAIRRGFVVHFDEVAAGDLFMGDAPMVEAGESGRAAIVDARVMAGPWNDDMKAQLFERLEKIVRDVANMPKSGAGADFWMTIVEVPEGAWGLGGRAVSIEQLAPVFSDDRQDRIRSYLAKHHS